MANSGDNPRIQVAINGTNKATAGLESLGVLSFNLSWVRRDPDTAPPEAFSMMGHSRESWRDGVPEFNVGALDASKQLSVEWISEKLKIGDEVVVRIMPPGEIDVPLTQKPQKVPQPLSKKAKSPESVDSDALVISKPISSRKPVWIQNPEEPECCGRKMVFVGQINDTGICKSRPEQAKRWWGDLPSFYVFTCSQCLKCNAIGQQY